MQRWTKEQATQWYADIPWPVGCNFLPKSAVNSTEMWQEATYDLPEIRKELRLAASIGMNTVRVFLPYIVWKTEGARFTERFGSFLAEADAVGMRVMPILFDDCAFADKEPYYGPQDAPVIGVHNSGWTPSPGFIAADDPAEQGNLRAYVMDIVGTYQDDARVLVWDMYNEPGNSNRKEKCLPLLRQSFAWAREAEPSQPLTCGVWAYEPFEDNFAELCDVLSFHCYAAPEVTRARIEALRAHGRPVFCTEWLHRPSKSCVETHLPLFREYKVGIYNWGLVLGRTQTNLSWDTMHGQPDAHPVVWQHDLFTDDGQPYRVQETDLFKRFTTA